MNTAYERAFEKLKDKYWKDIKNLVLHKELFEIAEEHGEKFSEIHEWKEGARFSLVRLGSVFGGVVLDLYLAEEDPAKYADPFIENLIRDKRLDLRKAPPKILEDTSSATWEFMPHGSKRYFPCLRVTVNYSYSNSCKLIPSGRFTKPEEIKIMVCS